MRTLCTYRIMSNKQEVDEGISHTNSSKILLVLFQDSKASYVTTYLGQVSVLIQKTTYIYMQLPLLD